MNLLVRDLRLEMEKRQDEFGSPYLLTIAIPATDDGLSSDKFDFKTLNDYVDYYNIMSYALNKTSIATHLTALCYSSYSK